MLPWLYNGEAFISPNESDYGFVYLITNLQNGKMYVGKKLFWFKRTKTLKGKKKRYLAESDWQGYFGSSIVLNKEVKEIGSDQFKREILHLCTSKGECSYLETKEQIERAVLFNPEMYYNDWIICRVHRKHELNENGEKQSTPQTKKKPGLSISL